MGLYYIVFNTFLLFLYFIQDELDHVRYILQQKVMCDEYPEISYSIPATWKDCILKCLIETEFSIKYPKIFKIAEKYFGKYKEKYFKFTPKVIYPNIKNEQYSIKYFAKDLDDSKYIKSQDCPYYGLFMYHDNNMIHLEKTFLRHEYDYYAEKCENNKRLFIGEISKIVYEAAKYS